jgi:urease accessory protein
LTQARVTEVLEPGVWTGPPADHVTLSDHGVRALLDLPHAILLAGGSGLRLEDGRILEVRAQIEPLLEVRAQNAARLLRLAWHIGNRHLSAQIEPDRILIRLDHVIAAMLTGLGATVTQIEAPFDPEGGAYGGRHTSHDHGHDHGHDHAAPHNHEH